MLQINHNCVSRRSSDHSRGSAGFLSAHSTVRWEQSLSQKINVSSFVTSVMRLLFFAQWRRGGQWASDGRAWRTTWRPTGAWERTHKLLIVSLSVLWQQFCMKVSLELLPQLWSKLTCFIRLWRTNPQTPWGAMGLNVSHLTGLCLEDYLKNPNVQTSLSI